jgi:hypothetical protein
MGEKLVPAEVAAKTEGFLVVFVIKRGSFIYWLSTNGEVSKYSNL